MDIGSKIREMRLQKDLTQEELADRCDLTKGYISQLENDISSPSIATLKDILLVLGSNLSNFFDVLEDDDKVVFGSDDYILKQSENVSTTWLVPSSQKNTMEPIKIELQPHASTYVDNPHEGEEFGYVLQGSINIKLGKKTYTAKMGESFYYRADKAHSLSNSTDQTATILWVSNPPNF